MTDFFTKWVNQSSENARLVAQELLITEVTEAIWKAMEEAGVNKTELAGRMEATKGYVSQVLSGSRNMTLRTLADICFALGEKPSFHMVKPSEQDVWRQMPEPVKFTPGGVHYVCDGKVIMPNWGKAA